MDPEELKELVRRANDAWNGNDWETLEDVHDPEVEMLLPPNWPEAELLRGWPAVRRQYERLKESLDREHADLVHLETKNDVTVSGYRWGGQGEGSGISLEMEVWRIDTFRDGRVVRVVFFLSRDEALAAFEGAGG